MRSLLSTPRVKPLLYARYTGMSPAGHTPLTEGVVLKSLLSKFQRYCVAGVLACIALSAAHSAASAV